MARKKGAAQIMPRKGGQGDKGAEGQRDKGQIGRGQEDRGTGTGCGGKRMGVGEQGAGRRGQEVRGQGTWFHQHQTQHSVTRSITKFII